MIFSRKLYIILIFYFLAALPNVLCSVLIADQTMSKMIELRSSAPFCKLHSDRGVIQKMVLSADIRKVRQMSNGAITDLEVACRENKLTVPNQGGFLYPGTKWCGPGNRASSYKELGAHAAEDRCCREHDHCPAALAPGECRKGVCNSGRYTRSHCDCDARFRRCLQALNTETANTIGAIYFNVVQVTCFKERRPCSQWQSLIEGNCDPTPVFVKMPSYKDRRNPFSLKNLLFLGDNQIARFNQGITVGLGIAVKNILDIFD